MGDLLTPEEVCEKLGVSESTLRNWRRDHTGPQAVFLSARKIRYRSEDIEAWVTSKATASVTPDGEGWTEEGEGEA